jgi:phosphotransferase system enzyme I (PtsP)
MRVHGRGDPRLDGFLDLIAEASRPRALEETLTALARRIAELVGAPVCSIYLPEAPAGEAGLVLRANVGFPAGAVGQVRLRAGEGITGFAALCERPVSVAAAARDPRNKPVPGIGEERYPVFLAVPLLGDGAAAGALVVQRAAGAFTPAEVTLVAALAMPVVHAVTVARSRAAAASEDHPGPVRLVGEPAVPGLVVGSIGFARRSDFRARVETSEDATVTVRRALCETVAALEMAARPFPELRAQLADTRLGERALELAATGLGAARAFERVAREVARVAELAGDATLRRRAVDVEGLCDRAAARSLGQPAPSYAPGTVLCAHRLSSWDALELAQSGGVGAVLAGGVADSPGLAVARSRGLASSAGLGGVFHWARAGARILVDGEAGAAVIHPGPAEMAAYRAQRPAAERR